MLRSTLSQDLDFWILLQHPYLDLKTRPEVQRLSCRPARPAALPSAPGRLRTAGEYLHKQQHTQIQSCPSAAPEQYWERSTF